MNEPSRALRAPADGELSLDGFGPAPMLLHLATGAAVASEPVFVVATGGGLGATAA